MDNDDLSPDIQKQIQKGIEILRQGGLVAYPTDTVYGLGCGINMESSVTRVYEVKQRSPSMSVPVLLSDIPQVHDVARDIPAYGWRLMSAFWPGGLTLVVYHTKSITDVITGGGDTVAIRVPDHPVPRALIKGYGSPIVGTSANIHGHPNTMTADEVRYQLGEKIDLIIDGGPLPGGKESTIVDVTGEVPVILRHGAISKSELEKVVDEIV